MDYDKETHLFSPIGVIKSPFKQKFATPRQSLLAPSAQATVIFDKSRVPEGSLVGLSDFSHIWLIFYFHKSG
ncbi:MAG: SAM-dependent methyltransferase, partial [Bdellovibrionales bacterium]|nr:TrmO family methyltransferase [Bdellovibrionales bacterium]NQZ20264.1 SAM-dependent methyltransferase [Bdellovibrionales bacterium]